MKEEDESYSILLDIVKGEKREGMLKVKKMSFDSRAAQVRKTLNQFKCMPQTENAGEGFITAAQVRENMLTDMRSFIKQLEAQRVVPNGSVRIALTMK